MQNIPISVESDFLHLYHNLFKPPELTNSKYSFCDAAKGISFNEANVVLFGIPLDITTSFGKGTKRGPEAIRKTSARQIETFVFEEKIDFRDKIKIFDLGDLILPNYHDSRKIFAYLDKVVPEIIRNLSILNKKPLVLGGEHTLSYYCFKGLSYQKPLLIHFDAHRDLKDTFRGMKMCHATPFFRLIEENCIKGHDIIQIGIRQADREEEQAAENHRVVTFDPWKVKTKFEEVLAYIRKCTKNRNIYISFDIDVLDAQYVPCTGTPEPFGLNPFEIIKIINSIDNSATLIGMDLVEASLKNDDYREGTIASQILLRVLSKKYFRNVPYISSEKSLKLRTL